MQDRKTVNNAIYKTSINVGASKFKQVQFSPRYYANIVFFISAWIPISRFKVFLLRLFGARYGQRGMIIKPSVNIKYPWKLEVGNHTWIGEGVWIDNLADVRIGNNVTLSQGCMILTAGHNHKLETFDYLPRPVVLEDGVWITAKALVFGVTCKSHSILGVNSVAEKDLEPYSINKGNPAVKVGNRIIF